MTDDPDRSAPIASLTSERTADQTTQSASGLGAMRPGTRPEREPDDDSDTVDRDRRDPSTGSESTRAGSSGDRDVTPRRYDEQSDDPVLPSDDSSLNTKI